ncbi:MAG: beta-galactosidase trimerization domain-containing protein [Pirellulales bacterium]|nr:beta-galactosidase trimerization domain-containing protein [Pirellulales bacterium]
MRGALPTLLLACWPLFLFAPLAQAQTEPEVWERQIMHQPFDTQPLRAVRVPEWVQETLGCGYTLSAMDTAGRTAAASHGVTLSELGFVNPFFACYESRYIERRSPDFPPGRLEREIAEYQRLGVRVLAVYPPCLQGEVYEKHPEWRRIATHTTEIPSLDLQQFPHGGMLCLLGPYGDFMIDVLEEILTRFPQVDAFSFDGLHYGGVCYCQHCRDAYHRDTGEAIPDADLRDPAFRRYQHWADRRMEDLLRRMQNRLKRIKPEVALVTWSTNAGRYGHFLSIPRNMPARMNLLLDAPDQEFWMDEVNRGTTILPAFGNAYVWAATNHRVAFSEPYLMSHGNPYGKDSFPPHEILRRMMLVLTYGAMPSVAVAQPPRLQDELYRCLDEVQRRKPWLVHKRPEPWAALLMSDNTRNFYGQSPGLVEERYLAAVLGLFRAAVEEHLPLAVINDWNLNDEDLAAYRVLILPNAACLDDEQAAGVERFVRGGGGLVASLDASLFNEYGDARPNFALAEVLGVRYQGNASESSAAREQLDVNFAQAIGPDYWEKRKQVFDFRVQPGSPLDHGLLASYIGTEPVTFKGPAVRVAADPSADVFAWLRVRPAAASAETAGSAPSESPAVVARNHGKGRVVYLAAALDGAYYLYAYPYQRLVLRQAIEWAAAGPPPVQVEAPMCVHATCMRQQKQGQRLIIHLFNDVNTTAHHALPAEDVPLREEVLPIYDIRVTFSADYALRSVHLQPDGMELPIARHTDGRSTVTVPRLDVHSMVVAELGP